MSNRELKIPIDTAQTAATLSVVQNERIYKLVKYLLNFIFLVDLLLINSKNHVFFENNNNNNN